MCKRRITFFTVVFLSISILPLFFTQAQTYEFGDISTMSEEEIEAEKQSIKRLLELEKLIKTAKSAGFTDEELQVITIERNGEKIKVWDFIKQERERMRLAKKKMMEASNKRYLTVEDITEDLIMNEGNQLKEIKNNSIFSGEIEE